MPFAYPPSSRCASNDFKLTADEFQNTNPNVAGRGSASNYYKGVK